MIVLICLNPGTNRLINCFSGQIRANIDLSLLKIALASLVQILQTLVNIPRIDQKNSQLVDSILRAVDNPGNHTRFNISENCLFCGDHYACCNSLVALFDTVELQVPFRCPLILAMSSEFI